jgi:hypothetical protein
MSATFHANSQDLEAPVPAELHTQRFWLENEAGPGARACE